VLLVKRKPGSLTRRGGYTADSLSACFFSGEHFTADCLLVCSRGEQSTTLALWPVAAAAAAAAGYHLYSS